MRTLLLAVALALVPVLSGCVSANVRWHTSQDPGPLAGDTTVAMYYAGHAPEWTRELGPATGPVTDLPPGAFRVAEIEVTDGPLATWTAIRSGAEDSARELGADAIVVNGMQDPRTSQRYVFFTLFLREPRAPSDP